MLELIKHYCLRLMLFAWGAGVTGHESWGPKRNCDFSGSSVKFEPKSDSFDPLSRPRQNSAGKTVENSAKRLKFLSKVWLGKIESQQKFRRRIDSWPGALLKYRPQIEPVLYHQISTVWTSAVHALVQGSLNLPRRNPESVLQGLSTK